MFGKLGDVFNQLKQGSSALGQLMQEQKKLKAIEVGGECKVRGHSIVVRLNGLAELINIKIDPGLLSPENASEIRKGILKAYNEAKKKMEKELKNAIDPEQFKKMLGM